MGQGTKVCAVASLWLTACSLDASGSGPKPETASFEPASSADAGPSAARRDGGSNVPDAGDALIDAAVDAVDRPVRLNHLQLRGSFQSYHTAPTLVFEPSRGFSHAPLATQLETQRVRALHLDLNDSGRRPEDIAVESGVPLDSGTTCANLPACLAEVQRFSREHPGHVPVVIMLRPIGGDDFPQPERLDDVIRSVFSSDELLTPDDVLGDRTSLREAIESDGWPALDDVRGRVMFVLSVSDARADRYTSFQQGLSKRAMFVSATPDAMGRPWAVVLGDADKVPESRVRLAIEQGYLVLGTTCTADQTPDACNAQRERALALGVHALYDAFPVKVDGRADFLDMEDSPRCNPVTAHASCATGTLEPDGG